MSTPHFTDRPGDMDILDFWTQCSLDAYWKELVKETQEVNLTGPSDEHDSDTGPSDEYDQRRAHRIRHLRFAG